MIREDKRDFIALMAFITAAVSVVALLHLKETNDLNREIDTLETALQTDVVVCVEVPPNGWPPITKRMCETAAWRQDQLEKLMTSNAACLRARLGERETTPVLRMQAILVPGRENDQTNN